MLNIVIFEDDPKFACYLQQLIYPYLDTAKAEVDICNVTSFLEILKQTADKLTESAIFLLDFVIYEGRTEKDSGAMAQYIHSLNPGHVIIYITGYSGRLEDTTPLKLICTNIIRKQSKQLEWEIRYSIKAALDLLRKKGALIHSGMDRVYMDYNNILYVQSNKRTYKTMIRHVDGYLDSNYTLAEMMAVLDSRFYRCERSFIVNMDKIALFKTNYIVVADKRDRDKTAVATIWIPRRRRKEFINAYEYYCAIK